MHIMYIIMQIFIYYTYNNLNHFPCDNHLTCDKRALCDRGFPVSLAFGERSEPIASYYTITITITISQNRAHLWRTISF